MSKPFFRTLALVSALSLGGCFVAWSSKKAQKDEIQEILEANPELKNATGPFNHGDSQIGSKTDPIVDTDASNQAFPTGNPQLMGSSKAGRIISISPIDATPVQRHLMSGSKSGVFRPLPDVTPTPSTSNTVPVAGNAPMPPKPSPTPAPSKH